MLNATLQITASIGNLQEEWKELQEEIYTLERNLLLSRENVADLEKVWSEEKTHNRELLVKIARLEKENKLLSLIVDLDKK